jgi:hypothetical protein
MPQYDFLELRACARQVAGPLLRMPAPVVEREPEWIWISILAQHARQVDGASIDAGRCPGLEPFDRQAELVDLSGDFGCGRFPGSAGWYLGIQAEMNPSPQERSGGERDGAAMVRSIVQRNDTIEAVTGH